MSVRCSRTPGTGKLEYVSSTEVSSPNSGSCDQLRGEPVRAGPALVEAHLQLPGGRARSISQPHRVGERFSGRLLDEHIPSRSQSGDASVDMQCRRPDDDHGVEVRPRQQLVERAVRGVGAEPPARERCPIGVQVAHRHQARSRVAQRRQDRGRRVDPAADDRDADVIGPVAVGNGDRLGCGQLGTHPCAHEEPSRSST